MGEQFKHIQIHTTRSIDVEKNINKCLLKNPKKIIHRRLFSLSLVFSEI